MAQFANENVRIFYEKLVHKIVNRNFIYNSSSSWITFHVEKKTTTIKNILQVFRDNVGIRTINFIIIAYGNCWKR